MFDDTTIRELPTTPGAVVNVDGDRAMRTKFGNWVCEGVFTLTDEQMRAEDFEVEFDPALASRPAPAETPLPTEPRRYSGKRGSIWELDVHGNWWFRGYPGELHPTPSQQDRTESDVRTYGMPLTPIPAPVGEVERELDALLTELLDDDEPQWSRVVIRNRILSEFTVSRKVVS